MTYEGLRLKVLKWKRKSFHKINLKKIKNHQFTILSNNCWGGMVYESYGLQKQSPTVGLFFAASDYICFLQRLDEYLEAPLSFISPEQSRWKQLESVGRDARFGQYPIGVLSLQDGTSIEIFFLHYHSEEEARSKWERRCARVNRAHLLVKFNDQNGCTEEDVKAFMELSYANKLFFTCKQWPGIPKDQYVCIRQFPACDHIMASYEPFGKNRKIDLHQVINSL